MFFYAEDKDDNFDHDPNNVDCDCFSCIALIDINRKDKSKDLIDNQNQGICN